MKKNPKSTRDVSHFLNWVWLGPKYEASTTKSPEEGEKSTVTRQTTCLIRSKELSRTDRSQRRKLFGACFALVSSSALFPKGRLERSSPSLPSIENAKPDTLMVTN